VLFDRQISLSEDAGRSTKRFVIRGTFNDIVTCKFTALAILNLVNFELALCQQSQNCEIFFVSTVHVL
jgi:hypothetical protein